MTIHFVNKYQTLSISLFYINFILRRYIISAKPDRLFWKLSCVAIEKQRALWREKECPMEKIATHAQGSTVDALLLMHVNNILVKYLWTFFFIKN